jgi:hypothetical protein
MYDLLTAKDWPSFLERLRESPFPFIGEILQCIAIDDMSSIDGTGVMIREQSGRILSHRHWEELRAAIDEFYAEHSQQWIDEMHIAMRDEEVRARDADEVEQRQKMKQKVRPGYIYILESAGLYKIGRTKNLRQRVRHYETHSAGKITVLRSYQVKDDENAERILHEHFDQVRTHGEWFALENSERDLRKIDALLASEIV